MVKTVSVKNFKSVADLSFEARRINLFIGEPNAGKSNILEALSLFSILNIGNIKSVVRYDRISNLFFDNDNRNDIEIEADSDKLQIKSDKGAIVITLINGIDVSTVSANISLDGTLVRDKLRMRDALIVEHFERYKPYHFKVHESNGNEHASYYLDYPFGNNLADVLIYDAQLREQVSSLLNNKGYKLNLDSSRNEVNMVKEENGVLYTYPYRLFSDTLQRIIFYMAAIQTNEESILFFEEPEANTFPYYTKQLAEQIALDTANNQFFIATHNPYLLSSVVEKTPVTDMAVSIVYMENYQTKLYQLTDEQLSEVLDLGPDIFYNLERFLPEA